MALEGDSPDPPFGLAWRPRLAPLDLAVSWLGLADCSTAVASHRRSHRRPSLATNLGDPELFWRKQLWENQSGGTPPAVKLPDVADIAICNAVSPTYPHPDPIL